MLFMHFFVYSLSLIFPFLSFALYEIRCKYDYFYSNCKEKIDFFSLFFFKQDAGGGFEGGFFASGLL